MNKYLVRLCFQVTGPDHHAGQFDEQYRVIFAADRHAALIKAGILGETEAGAIPSAGEAPCEWHFAGIADIFDLDAARDGAFLYSETVHKDPGSYIQYLNLRHKEIQLKTRTFA
jgi:hypothetical protein